MTVGNSEFRTTGKHGALNAILGKTVGVMGNCFRGMNLTMIDCTAGDGVPTSYSELTSPFIFDKHGSYAKSRGINTQVIMYERAKKPAKLLHGQYGGKWSVMAGQDAKSMPKHWDDNTVLFVSNDPNTVKDWALPDALMHAPSLTTVFSTLGCNAGGLKRLSHEARQQWYYQMYRQIELLQTRHDAYLVMLEGDAAQWAYLVNAPMKWRRDTENAFGKAFSESPYPLRGAWLKEQPHAFSVMRDWLFMTRAEFAMKYGVNNLDIAIGDPTQGDL